MVGDRQGKDKVKDLKELYRASFKEHGATPQGVGWLDADVQRRRFFALMDGNQYNVGSILDVGCGYGELVEFLTRTRRQWFNHIKYTGIDVVPELIEEAKARHGHPWHGSMLNARLFYEADILDWVSSDAHPGNDVETYDLVVCSGALAFHDMPEKLKMLDAMWALTGRVLAFNMKADDVYIGDLAMMLPRFGTDSWRVSHDYGLPDMTVMVRR